MARPTLPDLSPWRRQPLIIPPNSVQAWLRLAVWESWMGMLMCGAVVFGARLIASAPGSMVTVFDYSRCYGPAPIVQPCERIAYRAGQMNVLFNVWCGLLMVAFAAWLVCELWNAVAPKPVTDDFLTLLDDSFGRDWRNPRTWPWTRVALAYGFTLVGAGFALVLALAVSNAAASSRLVKPPVAHVETSQRFRSTP